MSSNDLAISVHGVSKSYTIARNAVRHTTMAEALMHRLRRSRRAAHTETFWALQDVSFDVRRGDVVGIIGRNGAGKSTLLKILSRITEPTGGTIDLYGRVGSLLEVGTGFHPELTGRENIYLNGSILGMRRAEIAKHFDAIVDFAEVEQFLDTPVKRYSSGMYVRLAFAVAAYLNPEILIVDEVLAVGDADFQKKCLGKMEEVAKHDGRTVLFVSHNMGAVGQLCTRGVLMEKGMIAAVTTADEAVRLYLKGATHRSSRLAPGCFQGSLASIIEFAEVTVNNVSVREPIVVEPTTALKVEVSGHSHETVSAFRTTLSIYFDGHRLLTLHDCTTPETLLKGDFISTFEIPSLLLRPGTYSLGLGGYRDGMVDLLWCSDLATFTVVESWSEQMDPINLGLINVPRRFETNRSLM